VRRRQFLQHAALGATVVAAAMQWRAALAWADEAPDLEAEWWNSANFAPVTTETTEERLRVVGRLPRSLNGLYVRNGTNAHPGTVSPHWFIGDGMVHGVRLDDGAARWYRNRWVHTFELSRDTGLTGGGGPPSLTDGYANVSVIHHAGRLLASGEVGLPWELSPDDLSTLGVYDFDGRLRTSMTAHPKIDPETGDLHFFGYWFAPPYLTYHVATADGALVHSEPVDIPAPTMIHDFAITDRDVVFWDLPVVFDLDRLDTGIPFAWHPSHGARIGIMPLGGPASAIRWVDIEPCYVFHGVNAFRDGDAVVVDVCRHDRMFDPGVTDSGALTLRRWRISTGRSALRFSEDVVEDRDAGELPTRDPRKVGRAHRFGYLLRSHHRGDALVFGGVAKQDFRTGRREVWRAGERRHGNEFLFVPDGPGEDDGHLLAYVHDDARDAADLVVLDARDVAAGPVATVQLPTRVPYGFHAAWVPAS
jgi:carotenoid cleavage dioxygenase